MVNQQLLDYIKNQKDSGVVDGEIRNALINQGWSVQDVNEAFKAFSPQAGSPLPPAPAGQVTSPPAQVQQQSSVKDEKKPRSKGCLIWGIIIAVVLVILAGLGIFAAVVLVGINPAAQMKRARDSQRLMDANNIHNSLMMYYVKEFNYPESLDKLIPDELTEVPIDPETKIKYSYKVTNEGEDFELCVDFEEREDECLTKEKARFSSPIGDSSLNEI